jgi:transposase-like protein
MIKKHDEYFVFLEQVRWSGMPTCPYCYSTNSTAYRQEQRHHCNSCFTSYSVTVDTLFHKTRIELRKWFLAIVLIKESEDKISIRELSRLIGVDKNTAMNIIDRVDSVNDKDKDLVDAISRSYQSKSFS